MGQKPELFQVFYILLLLNRRLWRARGIGKALRANAPPSGIYSDEAPDHVAVSTASKMIRNKRCFLVVCLAKTQLSRPSCHPPINIHSSVLSPFGHSASQTCSRRSGICFITPDSSSDCWPSSATFHAPV